MLWGESKLPQVDENDDGEELCDKVGANGEAVDVLTELPTPAGRAGLHPYLAAVTSRATD